MDHDNLHLDTKAVHGPLRQERKSGPVVTPIVQCATFRAASLEEQRRVRAGDQFYTRYGNPSQTEAENAIAELESTEGALVFSSGMAAISSCVLTIVRTGTHIVAQHNLYGSTYDLFAHWLPRLGIETSFVRATEPAEFARAIRPETKIIYVESPANPTLQVVDIAAIAAIARKNNVLTLIDSTFASPVNQKPQTLGVDVVIHSATKFLSGHADVICGAVAADSDFLSRLRESRITFGGVLDPHAAWLLRRGLKTLGARMALHNENALRLASFLEQHPRVHRVYYPFLESHLQYALAKRQMTGGGGVVSFEIKGTAEDIQNVVESLRLFALAPSLGGVESLVTVPALTSHAMLSIEERKLLGVSDQLIRLSVGIEHPDDLIADLDQALSRITSGRETSALQR
jgi:cystathionine beta-lyase/cystathionine gamma-synthase